jgi:hypothetical protein
MNVCYCGSGDTSSVRCRSTGSKVIRASGTPIVRVSFANLAADERVAPVGSVTELPALVQADEESAVASLGTPET